MFAANGIEDSILKTVHKYQWHPSILAIKGNYQEPYISDSNLSLSDLQNELKSLESIKSLHESIKERMDCFSPFLVNFFNNIIDSLSFRNHLK